MPAVIVSVTPLGAAGSPAAIAAGVDRVIAYHEDAVQAPTGASATASPAGSTDGDRTPSAGAALTARYYADSEGPGRWVGRGAGPVLRHGVVDADELRQLLLGRDPISGERLDGHRDPTTRRVPYKATGEVGRDEAAAVLGVHPRRVHKWCVAGERWAMAPAMAWLFSVMSGAKPPELQAPSRFLVARRDTHGNFRIPPSELRAFPCRVRQRRVFGYDVTFSVPKSVSVLWAVSNPAVRAQIVAAVDAAIATGVAYLEDHAMFVRVGAERRLVQASGMLAASYLHATSRAVELDPQLHRHVVVLNLAAGPDGKVRAVDGRGLFGHAKTAGYLAAAELRHQLTNSLGVAWEPVINGVADITGVPRPVIEAMSQRAEQIREHVEAQGGGSARARQLVAYHTRPAKDHAVKDAELFDHWRERAAELGFDPAAARACLGRRKPVPLTDHDRDALFGFLRGAAGVTANLVCFDRRDVIQAVAVWGGARMSATEIVELADAWLATAEVLPLAQVGPQRRADRIRTTDGRTVRLPVQLYTTATMLAIETRITELFRAGLDQHTAVIPTEAVNETVAARPSLGEDQTAMVQAICRSGHRAQCVLGPAGTGKTFALEVAARAWEAAGYQCVGAAVQGTAAEVLGDTCGIASRTLASLLTALDTADPTDPAVLDERTVVLVDEASTIGNRDLARLLTHITQTGAALRLVGDPAQHSAVAAGGAWRRLVEQFAHYTPALTTLRRQQGNAMAPVRLALHDYRHGHITDALHRLLADSRVVQADTPDELLDTLVADWYVDRQAQLTNPRLPASSMVAEHHSERRELNRRARVLLQADGTLRGPVLQVAGQQFQAGDQVIARTQDRRLHPPLDRKAFVRNGTRGVVVAIHNDALVVDFAHRGPITVPKGFLERQLQPGVVGGLTHSYCLTSHAAQGETYAAARYLGSDRSTRAGVYVGLSRGRHDTRLYAVRMRVPTPVHDSDPGLPVLPRPERDAFAEVAEAVLAGGIERLASELDPDAAAAGQLAASSELHRLARDAHSHTTGGALAAKAWRIAAGRIAAQACALPPAYIEARLGPRPQDGPARQRWDRAVANIAIYQASWQPLCPGSTVGGEWAIGLRPHGDHHVAAQWDTAARAVTLACQDHAVAAGANAVVTERDRLRRLLNNPDPAVAAPSEHCACQQLDVASQPPFDNTPSPSPASSGAIRQAAVADAAVLTRSTWAQVETRAASGDPSAKQSVAERIRELDRAVDAIVNDAVSRPRPYLIAALGAQPHHEPAVWERQARRIEHWRVERLGRGPDDGPATPSSEPIEAAIGPRPPEPDAARRWDDLHLAPAEAVRVGIEPALSEPPTIDIAS